MEHATTDEDRPGRSKCKVQSDSLGEQKVPPTSPRVETSTKSEMSSSDPIGHSNATQKRTDQLDNRLRQHERLPVLNEGQSQGQGRSVSSDMPRGIFCGSGEGSLRPSGTPLRLRRLPASFWQEPNVPKDSNGKLMATEGCLGSCGCQLHRPPFQNDVPSFGYGDYDIRTGLRSKYLDPASPPAFHRPGHSFDYISKFSGDPALELAYLDASAAPWNQGAVCFPPAVARGDMRPVYVDRPTSSARTAFSATAALYGHMMRRSFHNNYHHGRNVSSDHLVSPVVTDDLWRLLPNRPLINDFSKRFHPYL